MRGPAIDEVLARVRAAASGLRYPSETDAPFTAITLPDPGGPPTPAALLAALGREPGLAAETTGLAELFAPLTASDDASEARRFIALAELLTRELTDLTVLRIGALEVDIYVLGRHPAGAWLGLQTRAVET